MFLEDSIANASLPWEVTIKLYLFPSFNQTSNLEFAVILFNSF